MVRCNSVGHELLVDRPALLIGDSQWLLDEQVHKQGLD